MLRALKKTINFYFLSNSVKVIKSLPGNGEVCLLDIGAAGGVEPRWRPFIQFLNYVCFEPDERSRNSLRKNDNEFKAYEIFPHALAAEKQTLNFNLCRKPLVSSLYEPNMSFLSRFIDADRFDILEKISTNCIPLDAAYKKHTVAHYLRS